MKIAENTQEIIRYILQFLLSSNDGSDAQIGYTADTKEFEKYNIVMKPSRFFDEDFYGATESLPSLPLQTIRYTPSLATEKSGESVEIPILYGEPKIEKINGTLILHADLIASTYFLISRYEEMVRRDLRDEHGRFPGKESLPFRAGFLQRPVVDEYGKILRKLLRETGLPVEEPPATFRKIYLTHDVDQLAHYRNLRGAGGAVVRFFKSPHQAFKAVQTYIGGVKHDPWYTFPWLFELAVQLKNKSPNTAIESITFIKTGGGDTPFDKPLHDINSNDFKSLFNLCKENNVKIGLHPSYQAGLNPKLIEKEKAILEHVVNQKTASTRNHFLANREPEDFQALIHAGLTDDFTMSYADVSGFRLGTSRAVRWINPSELKLSELILHPLTLMDRTLDDSRYMNLNEEEALDFSKKMIDEVKTHNGELVLLWHNTAVEENNGNYHRSLYEKLIHYLTL